MKSSELEIHLQRLFSFGFRPLFLCMVISALCVVGWWTAALEGLAPMPAPRNPVAWHAHEMLFGFVGAAVGGFLLTAVANWTRRPPVGGAWLVLLVLAWWLARLVAAADPDWSVLLIAAADSGYWILLSCLMAREVVAAKNYRNLKLVLILAVFATLSITYHFYPQPVIRATTLLVCILISVIGGRIIPAFTGNWLRLKFGPDVPTPVAFNRFDQFVILWMVLTAGCWTLFPGSSWTGLIVVVTGILQTVRLARWQGHRTLSDPLVFILHVGYAWIGIGLMLLGVAVLTAAFPTSAGTHALTVGAMGGLIVAVSSRAAFGHTNRPLVAGRLLSVAFILITCAAIARVAVVIMPSLLAISGVLWLLAFLLYGLRFIPVLIGPSPKDV